jgi:hypothetical protein
MRETIADEDFFAQLTGRAWSQKLRGPALPSQGEHALPAGRYERRDLLAAHMASEFPRWLRPNQLASALYSLDPPTSPQARIEFEDEAGIGWSRTNVHEPDRLTTPG